jgi:hypothetical protein
LSLNEEQRNNLNLYNDHLRMLMISDYLKKQLVLRHLFFGCYDIREIFEEFFFVCAIFSLVIMNGFPVTMWICELWCSFDYSWDCWWCEIFSVDLNNACSFHQELDTQSLIGILYLAKSTVVLGGLEQKLENYDTYIWLWSLIKKNFCSHLNIFYRTMNKKSTV